VSRHPGGGGVTWRPGGRELVVSALAVFLVALAVRAWAATQITFPAPEDTAYYVGVARNLLDGRGLVSDALWSYGTPPLEFPRPAFEIWLPLPAFLAAVPMAILGPSFAAAQVSSIVMGALVPVLAWRVAADVAIELGLAPGRARSLAIGTSLTSAVYLPLVLHSALPDSTMPFAVFALAACLLMTRIPGAGRPGWPLASLGILLGLAALTRNEAIWLALAWVTLVRWSGAPTGEQIRRIALVGVVAMAVFAPWAIRDWIVFGNPLPGQALSNALSLNGRDIFAWQDPPTLSAYLEAGPGVWIGTRITGFTHNVLNVLVIFGVPMSLIGIAALPRLARLRSLRALLIVAGLTFAVTSLLFPVATTWGTFLHAAGPVHVLLLTGCLAALDASIGWVGRRRGWTRPVAWLGPALAVFSGILFTAALLPSFGAEGRETEAKFAYLREALDDLDGEGGTAPVISDYPIWLAEETGRRSLALPDEPPASVLDLAAAFPGTHLLVVDRREGGGRWPAILEEGLPGSECFRRIDLPKPADPLTLRAVAGTQAYRVGCP
jgi:hypothetical protein